jgi:hypothetical protein
MQAAEPAQGGRDGISGSKASAGPKTRITPVEFRVPGEFPGKAGLSNGFADQEIDTPVEPAEESLLPFRGKFASLPSGTMKNLAPILFWVVVAGEDERGDGGPSGGACCVVPYHLVGIRQPPEGGGFRG